MRGLLILTIALVMSNEAIGQQTIKLEKGIVEDGIHYDMPIRNIEQCRDGVIVTYFFNDVVKHPNPSVEGTSHLKIGGFGINSSEGEPAVPVRWDSFVFSEEEELELIIIDTCFVSIPIDLTPARKVDVISSTIFEQQQTQPIKPYTGWFPKSVASFSSFQKYKGASIVNVKVSPVQYNYEGKNAKICSKLSYKICSNKKLSLNENKQLVNKGFDDYLYNTTLNYALNPVRLASDSPVFVRKDYLIVSVSEYESVVNRFADWKRTLGFNVHVELKDRGEWTTSGIQDKINEYRDNYDNLSYLLFIGDHQDVPAKNTTTANVVSDYYYCNSQNEISYIDYGRLSVSTFEEADTVINKVINYEKNPVTDTSFYTNAVICAYFQDRSVPSGLSEGQYAQRRFAQTAEDIRNHLMAQGKHVSRLYYCHEDSNPKYWNLGTYSFGEEIPTELQKPNFMWNKKAYHILDSINAGAFCVVHSDHGGADVWRDPWFHKSSMKYFTNGDKLPVVFSMNCETGKFNETNCFSESFLRKGNGGCVAIFAFSGDGYSGYNDALALGMFDAIWPTPSLIPVFPRITSNVSQTPVPTYRLGQIMRQGLRRMGETWGSSQLINERLHLFGDPSMQMYTSVPTLFTGISISYNQDNITVDTGGETATISFFNKQTNEVTAYEGMNATYQGDMSNLSICISAHNKIPYLTTTNYIQNAVLIGNNSFNADLIKAGNNVNIFKPFGDVIISSGKTTMTGKNIELHKGFHVNIGAELEIVNQ